MGRSNYNFHNLSELRRALISKDLGLSAHAINHLGENEAFDNIEVYYNLATGEVHLNSKIDPIKELISDLRPLRIDAILMEEDGLPLTTGSNFDILKSNHTVFGVLKKKYSIDTGKLSFTFYVRGDDTTSDNSRRLNSRARALGVTQALRSAAATAVILFGSLSNPTPSQASSKRNNLIANHLDEKINQPEAQDEIATGSVNDPFYRFDAGFIRRVFIKLKEQFDSHKFVLSLLVNSTVSKEAVYGIEVLSGERLSNAARIEIERSLFKCAESGLNFLAFLIKAPRALLEAKEQEYEKKLGFERGPYMGSKTKRIEQEIAHDLDAAFEERITEKLKNRKKAQKHQSFT